jgi:hypothetical protein
MQPLRGSLLVYNRGRNRNGIKEREEPRFSRIVWNINSLRLPGRLGVGGSNPLAPTNFIVISTIGWQSSVRSFFYVQDPAAIKKDRADDQAGTIDPPQA